MSYPMGITMIEHKDDVQLVYATIDSLKLNPQFVDRDDLLQIIALWKELQKMNNILFMIPHLVLLMIKNCIG